MAANKISAGLVLDSASQNLPDNPAGLALFLDVDGTLLPIAATPDAVTVDPATTELLVRLHAAFGDALALISGRSLPELDRLFAPQRFAAAGQHGAEWRDAGGRRRQADAHRRELLQLQPQLRALAAADHRLLIEDKALSLALHYRQAPERAQELAAALETALRGYPALMLQRGKCVLEVRAQKSDKSTAIRRLLENAPFAGRRPVFVGDDLTDEAGFKLVNALGGYSIKVGPEPSAASLRLANQEATLAWLGTLTRALQANAVVP